MRLFNVHGVNRDKAFTVFAQCVACKGEGKVDGASPYGFGQLL